MTKRAYLVAFTILGMSTLMGASAVAADFDAVKAKLETAMKADVRGEADTKRDGNRKPVETLEFFGLRDDMKVVELMPGGGWYTKLLAPVLAEKGELYIAYGAGGTAKALKDQPGFNNLKVIAEDAAFSKPDGQRLYSLSNTDLGVKNIDIVFTFRNYHNFAGESRAAINAAAFKALKKGGTYALIDHTRRHMQKIGNENGRRIDPVLAIKEIEAAGFEFVDYSDLHYRFDDDLRYEVGRKSVTGNTDRWTLKFRKP